MPIVFRVLITFLLLNPESEVLLFGFNPPLLVPPLDAPLIPDVDVRFCPPFIELVNEMFDLFKLDISFLFSLISFCCYDVC